MDNQQDCITLAHGNGGQLSQQLIRELFVRTFANPLLDKQADGALFTLGGQQLVFTTDSFVVKPRFFPGGNLGKLAVCGTVNDLAVMGAVPKYLSCGMIIEEGFLLEELREITTAIQKTATACGVQVVTGDTKVVEKGMADGLFINTSGIGLIENSELRLGPERLAPGDKVLINGFIGDHGAAVLTARKDFPVQAAIESDCAPLNGLVAALLAALPAGDLKLMRDATRGGIGTTLNEFCNAQPVGIRIDELALPVRETVATICELTGFDPLYIANEGKLLLVVAPRSWEQALEVMQAHPLGRDSCLIGEVVADHPGQLVLRSSIGGLRIVDMLLGDMLPRIC